MMVARAKNRRTCVVCQQLLLMTSPKPLARFQNILIEMFILLPSLKIASFRFNEQDGHQSLKKKKKKKKKKKQRKEEKKGKRASSVNNCLKWQLLLNHWTAFKIISKNFLSYCPLFLKFLFSFPSTERNGR